MWAAAVFPSITTYFTGIRQPFFLLLAGPHPRSLSLGGAASRRFPSAPRSGRRRCALSRVSFVEDPASRIPHPGSRIPALEFHSDQITPNTVYLTELWLRIRG